MEMEGLRKESMTESPDDHACFQEPIYTDTNELYNFPLLICRQGDCWSEFTKNLSFRTRHGGASL